MDAFEEMVYVIDKIWKPMVLRGNDLYSWWVFHTRVSLLEGQRPTGISAYEWAPKMDPIY